MIYSKLLLKLCISYIFFKFNIHFFLFSVLSITEQKLSFYVFLSGRSKYSEINLYLKPFGDVFTFSKIISVIFFL